MKKIILTLSILASLFTACQKEENGGKQLPDNPQNNQTTQSGTTTIQAGKEYIISPEVGGPNQPNQVYLDLSTGKTTLIKRDSWDIALYCGDEFYAILNPTIGMAVSATSLTSMTTSIPKDDFLLLNTSVGQQNQAKFAASHIIDDPRGHLAPTKAEPGSGTAIAEISANPEDNKIYLMSMGFEISNVTPVKGSVNLLGNHRGWAKIRVLRNGNGYKVLYAKNTTTHEASVKTYTVDKDPQYNFIFLKLETGDKVQVQPRKRDWDLCFSTFTGWFSQKYSVQNAINFYPDFIINNLLGGTRATFFTPASSIEERDNLYNQYTIENTKKLNLSTEKYNSQIIIGKNWRDLQNGLLRNVYFVIQDGDGNFFKLKIKAYKNDAGERGYPTLEYQLLK
ncbi:HmuY family protein [Capnocytophaga sp. oral taxon 878]|uniref:HmuY family protein n=1 Tax=Capnocytophaga sp. oral taxon 878 TaxID=1316596 RepID=UPI000D0386C1|nr:HmuY family protein [Capnocytophaga sp. oral taxon 878]AVM51230.1 hypothetical protein C4H12_12595 [Capnocytophaga sp. oral taxon 878]